MKVKVLCVSPYEIRMDYVETAKMYRVSLLENGEPNFVMSQYAKEKVNADAIFDKMTGVANELV